MYDDVGYAKAWGFTNLDDWWNTPHDQRVLMAARVMAENTLAAMRYEDTRAIPKRGK